MSQEQGPEEAPKTPPQTPYPLAIIICDAVHVDPATGKKTILGIFSAYRSSVFPFKIPQIAVYMSLTDGRGTTPFEFRLVKVDNSGEEEPAVFQAQGEIKFADPLAVSDLVLAMGNVEIPSPGEYRFQFFCCGEFVIERRLVIIDSNAQEKP